MDLSSLTDRLRNRIFWAKALGLLLAVTLFIYAFSYLTAMPSLCKSCHVIEPFYKSWLNSTHSNITCIACHRKGSWQAQLVYRLSTVKSLVKYLSTGQFKKSKKKEIVLSGVCEHCHVLEKEISPSGDIIIDHPKHLEEEGILCLTCHKEIGHRDKKKVTAAMETCYECHGQKNGPSDDCSICHSGKTPPDNHAKGWGELHGWAALRKGKEECLECHSKPKGFCVDCHKERPPSHDDRWNFAHSQIAAKTKTGCFICHKNDYCLKCHKESHPADWMKRHSSVARSKGIADCFECHGKKHCAECHIGRKSKVQ